MESLTRGDLQGFASSLFGIMHFITKNHGYLVLGTTLSHKVEIDAAGNSIRVYNKGNGFDAEIQLEERVYLPEMIFGHLLKSSNKDDNMKKTGESVTITWPEHQHLLDRIYDPDTGWDEARLV